MSVKKRTIAECARELACSEDDVKSALVDAGIAKRVTKATTLDDAKFLALSEHIKEKRAASEKQNADAAKRKPPTARKIGGTQVTETRQRERARRPRPSVRELLDKSGLPAPAAPADAPAPAAAAPAPAAESAPAAGKPPPAVRRVIGGDYDPAQLLSRQAEEQRQAREAAEKKKPEAPAAAEKPPAAEAEKTPEKTDKPDKPDKRADAGKGKGKKPGTITLDQKALNIHRRKRKKTISRREARAQTAEQQQQHAFQKPTAPVVREVRIPEAIAVSRLAGDLSLKSGVIIRKLMDHGMTVTANELLDKETAWIIVEELGHRPVEAPSDDIESELQQRARDDAVYEARAPVITVMGHVDHGKTSLLDYIRKTRVAVGEAGGITQHIGAYRVESAFGPVTFIDTPGHALFTQMRARGAQITDIVVLVVAADDGVKPQTLEAINHAKSAGVPIVVAVNKMDKAEADLDKVKRELAANELLPEDWGGDALLVPVSAATGAGIDALLEALATQTEVLELKAPVNVPAVGVVIETRIDRGRGIVGTVVITEGVLRRGDTFLCGTESGRVRAMWNMSSPALEEAPPSVPVEIQGLSGVPGAGAELLVLEDERKARSIADERKSQTRGRRLSSRGLARLAEGESAEALLDAAAEEWRELKVVAKADVEGSREVLAAALSAVSGKRAGVKVVHSAVGAVTEADIYLAQTGGGVIIAFNVRPNDKARKLAEARNVKIIAGNVVYELVEKARDAVLNLLSPVVEETVTGVAEVLKVFNISKVGNIAGCRVSEGVMTARAPVRLVRDDAVIYEERIASLRHFKDEAAEVRAGAECGIRINKYNDVKAGDRIEAIERTETPPEM